MIIGLQFIRLGFNMNMLLYSCYLNHVDPKYIDCICGHNSDYTI